MSLLEVKGLKTYFHISQGEVKAVDDVSFSLDKGEAMGLVGESGSGKTTTALSIVRLLPKEGSICGGKIMFDGSDLASMGEADLQKRRWNDISIVFQGAMNALNPVMKVGEQISEAITLHMGATKKEAWARSMDLLEMVEIPKKRVNNYPHEFSGGMKQRVMIAMAIACDPRIIIGDEPTTALDVMVQAQILNLIKRLRREMHMGFILITHDLSILAETCDRIAIMYAGKIVETAAVDDIFGRTAHPYTKKLINCFPDISGEKRMTDGIPGIPPNMLKVPGGCPFHPRCDRAIDICREAIPEQAEANPGHLVSCHRWKEILNER